MSTRRLTETESILKRHAAVYEWALDYSCEHPGVGSDNLRGLIYKEFGKEYVNRSSEMMVVSLCAVKKASATVVKEASLSDLPLFSGEV